MRQMDKGSTLLDGDAATATAPKLNSGQELAALVEEIVAKIDNGEWPPGTRLPTERELEANLGISRNILRKGLNKLQTEGRIVRHIGRGTFVAGAEAAVVARPGIGEEQLLAGLVAVARDDSLIDILRAASPADLMEIRLIIEPAVAELAAYRASARQVAFLNECFEKMEASADIPEYEVWDAQFHETLISSARNETLTLLYAAITQARNSATWTEMKKRSVTAERRALYQQQHRAIVEAISSRNAERARSELTNHLREVRNHLLAS